MTGDPQPRAHVDGLSGKEIRGWAQPIGDRPARIGVFAGDTLLAETLADQFRPDLSAAGLGDVAFTLPIAGRIAAGAAATDGWVEMRRLEGRGEPIGAAQVPIARKRSLLGDDPDTIEAARHFLRQEIDLLLAVLSDIDTAVAPEAPPPRFDRHRRLFEPANAAGPILYGEPLPAYMRQVEERVALGQGLQADKSSKDADRLLSRYLTRYSAQRRGYRVPLTAAQIAHLNDDVTLGDTEYRISRALAWRLLARPSDRRADLDLDDLASVHRAEFWWAWSEAPRLGVEDCLISQATIARLGWTGSGVPEEYPLSPFLHHLANALNLPVHINGEVAEHRRLVHAFALMKAVRHPHILLFLTQPILRRIRGCADNEQSELSRLFAALGIPLPSGFSADDLYRAALRAAGFDLDALRFRTTLPEGHRLHAAALPAPAIGAGVIDVQVIGPFEKASGLGQAARLSAEALQSAGLDVNLVDFDLDNPAPEGYSGRTELGDYRRARINLLHLNAESVPLAFAYTPDVFSDAYNIGYFFWELDSPARCHDLAFDLLDEVWVSTEWLRGVYADPGRIPVTNVGLPAGRIPQVDAAAARPALRARIGAPAGAFVFFFDFDSYSFIQRKNPLATLEAFARAFPADPDVRIVVKSQNRANVIDPAAKAIWAEIDRRAAADPRILVMVETLPFEELLQLKAGADCYVSLHRAEGWGFGMIEAMQLGVPVICTGYSGNTEFCDLDTAWIVDHAMTFLAPDDYIFVKPGQSWADPDIDHAARQMRAVHDAAAARATRAATARQRVARDFSIEAIGRRYGARVSAILSEARKAPEATVAPSTPRAAEASRAWRAGG